MAVAFGAEMYLPLLGADETPVKTVLAILAVDNGLRRRSNSPVYCSFLLDASLDQKLVDWMPWTCPALKCAFSFGNCTPAGRYEKDIPKSRAFVGCQSPAPKTTRVSQLDTRLLQLTTS